jgi:hypothetical protein
MKGDASYRAAAVAAVDGNSLADRMDTNILGLDSKSMDGYSIFRENMIIQKRLELSVPRTARNNHYLWICGNTVRNRASDKIG